MARLLSFPRVERLWTAPDGTECQLAQRPSPPFFTVSLVKGATVLCERRLHGRASAQMVADAWSDTVTDRG